MARFGYHDIMMNNMRSNAKTPFGHNGQLVTVYY